MRVLFRTVWGRTSVELPALPPEMGGWGGWLEAWLAGMFLVCVVAVGRCVVCASIQTRIRPSSRPPGC